MEVEQRRTTRFNLRLPVAVTRSGAQTMSDAGVTANISSGGVLFTATRPPEIGGRIEYIITLNSEGGVSVQLRCMGKVLRCHPASDTSRPTFQVAATLERYEFLRGRN